MGARRRERPRRREKKRKTGERRRGGGEGMGLPCTRRAEAALQRRTAPGRNEGGSQMLSPRPPAGRSPASRSSSPYLGTGDARRATAGRRICFQPRSLTWRPTSCHRGCSGLPPVGWRRHLSPSSPASFCASLPAGGRAAGGQRPAREEVQRADDHRVRVQTPPRWAFSLPGCPLAILRRLRRHGNGSDGKGKTERSFAGTARSVYFRRPSPGVGLSGTWGVPCMELVDNVTILVNPGTGLRG